MHKQPRSMRGLVLLLTSLTSTTAKDELGPEFPVERDLPVLCGLGVDDGVVVLEVGAEAFGFEGDPEGVLVHGVCLLGPVAEVVGIGGCVEMRLV